MTTTTFRHSWKADRADFSRAWLGWHGPFMIIWLGCIATSIGMACRSAKQTDDFCMPDGAFSINPEGYNIWKFSGYFKITLGSGQLSFGVAKFVDVLFDVVVGRGGQAILALISYKVFKQYITSTMESTPISYGTYKTVFLGDVISLGGFTGLVREFLVFRRLPSTVGMIWMIASAIFLVAFPTLVSAMSGYNSNNKPFILDAGNNYMDYEKLFLIDYVVYNSSRLNLNAMLPNDRYFNYSNSLTEPYFVKRPKNDQQCPELNSKESRLAWNTRDFPTEDCYLRSAISTYVETYGFDGLNQTESSLLGSRFPAPALNISAKYIDPGAAPSLNSSGKLVQISTIDGKANSRFRDVANATYSTRSNNQTFVLGDSSTQGRCQPDITYMWGFSFLLLFNFLLVLLFWSVGTYLLWLNSRTSNDYHEEPEIAGGYKAVLELASVMNSQLTRQGNDPMVLPEEKIQELIRKDLDGGAMKYRQVLRQEKFRYWSDVARWGQRIREGVQIRILFAIVLLALSLSITFGLLATR